MKLGKWDDGYFFDANPRREDPLYYYLQEGGWGSALGFEVDPLCEEHTATSVSIRVWPQHLPREAGMDAAERCEMYHRVIPILLRRFPKWSRVTLQSSFLPEIMERDLLSVAFTAAGFCRTMSTTPNEQTWTKA